MKIYILERHPDGCVCVVQDQRTGEKHFLDPKPSQRLWNHSPTGFEFGYGGSGPAQLALAIMLDHLKKDELAVAAHQPFKWDWIATAQTGQVISSLEIDEWLHTTFARNARASL